MIVIKIIIFIETNDCYIVNCVLKNYIKRKIFHVSLIFFANLTLCSFQMNRLMKINHG